MESINLNGIFNEHLNSVNRNTRNAIAATLKDPIFTPRYDISLRQMKELALQRLKKIISQKMVSIRDFLKDPENIFTMHEMVLLLYNLYLVRV